MGCVAVQSCEWMLACWGGGGGMQPPSVSTRNEDGVFSRDVGTGLRGDRMSRPGEAQSNQFYFRRFMSFLRLYASYKYVIYACMHTVCCPISPGSYEISFISQNTGNVKREKVVAGHVFPIPSFGTYTLDEPLRSQTL
jgi:hypothetical protein